jgi:hypothetical protein
MEEELIIIKIHQLFIQDHGKTMLSMEQVF